MGKIKKFTKTLAIIGVAGGIALSSVGSVSAAQVHYKDVNTTDNFYNSVEYLLKQEAISRTLPYFRPYENITRGQFARIFVKVLNDDRLQQKVNSHHKFRDVPKSNQFYEPIMKLADQHIMSGYVYKSTSYARVFGINDSLTRGQIAGTLTSTYRIPTMSAESYKEKGGKVSDIFDGENFKGQWGEDIATLEHLGILSGYSDGNFKPDAPIKRSQFANIMNKIEHSPAILNDYVLKSELYRVGITYKESDKVFAEIKELKNNDVVNYVDSYYYTYSDVNESYVDIGYVHYTYLLLDIKKQGEVVLEDVGLKMKVAPSKFKDKYNYNDNRWDVTFENIEETEEEPATTEDTTTVTETE